MRKSLKRDDILRKRRLPTEWVPAPEWAEEGQPAEECGVWVRSLTGRERDQFESAVNEVKGKAVRLNYENIRARLCALAVCDEVGNPILTAADVDQLGEQGSAVLDRLFAVASRLSGLSKADVEEMSQSFPNGQGSVSLAA